MSTTAIFLSAMLAALVQAAYKGITGKDMFPANPKGPLYKWFGGASHREGRELIERRLRDQEEEQLFEALDRRPAKRLRDSPPKP